jgi:hypothetical protein
VRIVCWPPLRLPYLRYVMLPVRAPSFTVAKEIYESVLQLQSVYLVCATLYR